MAGQYHFLVNLTSISDQIRLELLSALLVSNKQQLTECPVSADVPSNNTSNSLQADLGASLWHQLLSSLAHYNTSESPETALAVSTTLLICVSNAPAAALTTDTTLTVLDSALTNLAVFHVPVCSALTGTLDLLMQLPGLTCAQLEALNDWLLKVTCKCTLPVPGSLFDANGTATVSQCLMDPALACNVANSMNTNLSISPEILAELSSIVSKVLLSFHPLCALYPSC